MIHLNHDSMRKLKAKIIARDDDDDDEDDNSFISTVTHPKMHVTKSERKRLPFKRLNIDNEDENEELNIKVNFKLKSGIKNLNIDENFNNETNISIENSTNNEVGPHTEPKYTSTYLNELRSKNKIVPSEEINEEETVFTSSKPIKVTTIPDQSAIEEIKRKKQLLRNLKENELNEDIIYLDEEDDGSNNKREIHKISDENDDDDDLMETGSKNIVNAYDDFELEGMVFDDGVLPLDEKAQREQTKQQKLDIANAIYDAQIGSDSDISDISTKRWESEQIHKASYGSKLLNSELDNNIRVPTEFPAAQKIPSLTLSIAKLKSKLENMKVEKIQLSNQLKGISDQKEKINEREIQLKTAIGNASLKYKNTLNGLISTTTNVEDHKPLEIYKDDFVRAVLSDTPLYLGDTIVSPISTTPIYTYSQSDFIQLFQKLRMLSRVLKSTLEVRRVALITTSLHEVRLYPLSGLSDDWEPIMSSEKVYNEVFPGYITTEDANPQDPSILEATKRKIINGYDPNLTLSLDTINKTFFGDITDDNLFAKLTRGEIPQYRIWENDTHLAFLTPFPNTPAATVVIPRHHTTSDILSQSEEDYKELLIASYSVIQILKKSLGLKRIGIAFEGFEIDYAHVKLYPIWEDFNNSIPENCETVSWEEVYQGFITSQKGPMVSAKTLNPLYSQLVKAFHDSKVDDYHEASI